MAVGDDDDLAFRVADQPAQEIDHHVLCEAAVENSKQQLPKVGHRRDDVAAETLARAGEHGRLAARREASTDDVVAAKTRLIFPINMGFFAFCATFERGVFVLELLSNFVDEPNQAASFSCFSPSMN